MDDIGTGAPGIKVDSYDVQADHIQVTAHHFGYDGMAGKPVLSRSIWYDKVRRLHTATFWSWLVRMNVAGLLVGILVK